MKFTLKAKHIYKRGYNRNKGGTWWCIAEVCVLTTSDNKGVHISNMDESVR